MIARHAFVSGRVQGVGFRWHTKNMARELGLFGFVQNLDDGRVEVFLQGEAELVERLCSWLHHGPPGARVEQLELTEAALTAITDFRVLGR